MKPGTRGAFSAADLAYLKERAVAVKKWAAEVDALAAARQAKISEYAPTARKIRALASTIKGTK
jgi:hypothetical protein